MDKVIAALIFICVTLLLSIIVCYYVIQQRRRYKKTKKSGTIKMPMSVVVNAVEEEPEAMVEEVKEEEEKLESEQVIANESSAISEDVLSIESTVEDATPRKLSKANLIVTIGDIYETNAFRVLQVPVTISSRELARLIRRRDLRDKYGDTEEAKGVILPLKTALASDSLRIANQRLIDPISRFTDEIFWFWPLDLNKPEDDALAALKRNDKLSAIASWKEYERSSSLSHIAVHNLAIIYHLSALDIERQSQLKNLTEEKGRQRTNCWEQSLTRWHTVIESDVCWKYLEERISKIDDFRLKVDKAHQIWEQLPLEILLINGELAVQAAQNNNQEEVSYQLSLINNSGFKRSVSEDVLRKVAEPMREQIKIILTNEWESASRKPENSDKFTKVVLNQTTPLLTILDILLPQEHSTLVASHDEVATVINKLATNYGNKTKNWRVSLDLIKMAYDIAISKALRKRIGENIINIKKTI